MVQRITLRAYLDELAALLREESFNEVISHCRHILQHYPQNVETYRLLGQALLQRGHHGGGPEYFDQAAEVFQRVLAVSPIDHVAHLCMGEIREHRGQLDQAIWHLERAYEQMPGNTAIQEEVRKLYARRDGEDRAPEKIQLTRSALARQYANGQLYDQALIELRAALEQMPGRIDLQILLAETFWESQHFVEAAEVAAQILRKLPNCLAANRILAQVWLENERPTDAQAFLDRIMAVDPYVAVQIVRPDVNMPDTNILAHLDYNAQAAATLSTETPDWVQELGELGAAEMDAVLSLSPQVTPMDEGSSDQLDMNALFGNGMGDDVPNWVDEVPDARAAQLPDWFGTEESVPAPSSRVPGDIFDNMTPSGASSPDDDLPDWFAELGEDTGTGQTNVDSASPGDVDSDLFFAEVDDLALGAGLNGEQAAPSLFEEPDWMTSADAGEAGALEPSFEDLIGPVGEPPVEEPDWMTSADAGEAGALESSLEDLSGPVGELSSEEQDWLQGGADMVSGQEEPPSGFTDLLAEVEASRPVVEDSRAEMITPPEWIAAFREETQEPAEAAFSGSLDDETEFLSAFDQTADVFDIESGIQEVPEPTIGFTEFEVETLDEETDEVTPSELEALRQGMMPPPDTDFSEFMPSDEVETRLGGAVIEEPTPGQPSDWMTESEQDYFSPATEWEDELKPASSAEIPTGSDDWLSGMDEVDEADFIEKLLPADKPDLSEPTDEEPDREFGWTQPETAADDWLSSFAKVDEESPFSELRGDEFVSAEQPPDEEGAPSDEWVEEVADLVTFETVEESLFGPGDLEKEPEEELLTEEIEAESLAESMLADDDSEPAWMADLAPIDSPSMPDASLEPVDQLYDPYEGGGPEQVPSYRTPHETGILQPDEEPDWMKAFSGDEALPDEKYEVDDLAEESISLSELDLGLEPVADQAYMVTDSLADMEFGETQDSEEAMASDALDLPAEGGDVLPDWLVAITSSEADKLEDVVWEEPETYSSAEDTGVLQPSSQPDWLMSVAEQGVDEEQEVDKASPDVALEAIFEDFEARSEEPAELDLSGLDFSEPALSEADSDQLATADVLSEAEPLTDITDEEISEVWDEAAQVGLDVPDVSLFETRDVGEDEEMTEDRVEIDTMFFDQIETESEPEQLAEADAAFFDALKASVGEPADSDQDDFEFEDLDLRDEEVALPVDLAHTSDIVEKTDEDDISPDDFAFRNKMPAWLRPPKESNLASPAPTVSESAPEIPEWLRDISEDDESE